jgi:hypothetical protein
MSTRACYRFIDRPGDGAEIVTVYKHSDGYPEGAVCWITRAIDFAWPLPRFEADEFAAAFIAANKKSAQQRHAEYQAKAECETDPQIKAHLQRSAEDWRPGGRYALACTGGDLRVVNQPGMDAFKSYASDIAFLYDVTVKGDALHVTVHSTVERDGKWAIRRVFAGSLAEMQARYGLEYLSAA